MKRFHVRVSVEDLSLYGTNNRTSAASAKSGEACCTAASATEPARFLHLSPRSKRGLRRASC
jgi:hypothetical protein